VNVLPNSDLERACLILAAHSIPPEPLLALPAPAGITPRTTDDGPNPSVADRLARGPGARGYGRRGLAVAESVTAKGGATW
jgi:hypothetical protein